MFDLAAYDAEIRRVNGIENVSADVLLARAVRGTPSHNAITAFGPASGMFVGVIGLAIMVLPALVGDATASPTLALDGMTSDTMGDYPMTFDGMTLDQFAMYMEMPVNDPLLMAMFEELCET